MMTTETAEFTRLKNSYVRKIAACGQVIDALERLGVDISGPFYNPGGVRDPLAGIDHLSLVELRKYHSQAEQELNNFRAQLHRLKGIHQAIDSGPALRQETGVSAAAATNTGQAATYRNALLSVSPPRPPKAEPTKQYEVLQRLG